MPNVWAGCNAKAVSVLMKSRQTQSETYKTFRASSPPVDHSLRLCQLHEDQSPVSAVETFSWNQELSNRDRYFGRASHMQPGSLMLS